MKPEILFWPDHRQIREGAPSTPLGELYRLLLLAFGGGRPLDQVLDSFERMP
ncbi:hypothetical protein [Haematobacter missouriensis]|uniref:hypothetical protein n=1 Tax=Haematobacter missouriensis TaxID=366616 RepID=UPI0012EC611C|nr:hypothetical protein [Haematobacter missouriensis]